jgi:hypothetical protein
MDIASGEALLEVAISDALEDGFRGRQLALGT